MKITIEENSFFSPKSTIVFDDEKDICLVDNVPFITDVKKDMQVILDCLCGAPLKMVDDGVLDGVSYVIKIEKNNETREYVFVNKFPQGFNNVFDIIGRLEKC